MPVAAITAGRRMAQNRVSGSKEDSVRDMRDSQQGKVSALPNHLKGSNNNLADLEGTETPTRPWWLGGGKVAPDDENVKMPDLSVPRDGSLPSWVDADDEEAVRWAKSSFGLSRLYIQRLYGSDFVQLFVALLIVANFIANCLEAQFVGEFEDVFKMVETIFTTAFTVELALNLYGNWWNKFGYDYWNWFDAVVVAISLLSLTMGGVEGIGALRLLRAFRVVRLFKRAASLRKILKAINQAIPGMRDAFAILMLVMMLYAIMGVDFYGPDHDVFFGNFLKAFFTMFQMMTTEGWADIARDVMAEQGDSHAIFFVTFIMLGNIILANVVIAVLIEQVCMKEDEGLPSMDPTYDEFTAKLLEQDLSQWREAPSAADLGIEVTPSRDGLASKDGSVRGSVRGLDDAALSSSARGMEGFTMDDENPSIRSTGKPPTSSYDRLMKSMTLSGKGGAGASAKGKRASAKPPREKSPGTPPIGAGGAGGSLSISEPALLLRLTTELVAMRDNMADMVDMFTDNQIRLQRIEAAMARSERTMSNTSAMGMEGISEPDVAALVSEMRNLERRLSTGIRPATHRHDELPALAERRSMEQPPPSPFGSVHHLSTHDDPASPRNAQCSTTGTPRKVEPLVIGDEPE